MRHFIRHPAEIPIEVVPQDHAPSATLHAQNVSIGGLAFHSNVDLAPGAIVDVRIPSVWPQFESKARVVWCSERANGFELGVEFLDANDAFRARMVEQVCYIENYRHEVHRTEGRQLTSEEAAHEWIAKHAADFPGPSHTH